MDEEKLGYFSRKPFAMDVGTVATPFHGVVLRVRLEIPGTLPIQIAPSRLLCSGMRLVPISKQNMTSRDGI